MMNEQRIPELESDSKFTEMATRQQLINPFEAEGSALKSRPPNQLLSHEKIRLSRINNFNSLFRQAQPVYHSAIKSGNFHVAAKVASSVATAAKAVGTMVLMLALFAASGWAALAVPYQVKDTNLSENFEYLGQQLGTLQSQFLSMSSNSIFNANITLQGNTFNVGGRLVQLTGAALYPALDGSLITNIAGSHVTGNISGSAALNVLKAGDTMTGQLNATTVTATALITKDPWVDIRSFSGATGCTNDGLNNCLQAFNMALQIVKSSGGTIFIPTGVWMTTDSIAGTNLEGISFVGEGPHSVIWAHDFNGRNFDFTDSDFIRIENLNLQGDGINAVKSTGGIIFRLNSHGNTEGNVIRNVIIGGGGADGCSGVTCGVTNTCLSMDTPITSLIEGVKADGCVGDGFFFKNGTSLTLNNDYAILGTQAGFEFLNMTYTSINSCASEVFGIGYWFENSKAITLNASGAESNINRSVSFPGSGYQVDSGTVTCLACYARSNDGGNVVELGTGHFDRIDYKDYETGEVTTKLNGFIIRSNGNVGIGVSTPAATMDVVGSAQFGSGAIKSTMTSTGEVIGRSSFTASAFFGDGSHLTGIPSTGSISGIYVLKTGDTMTGQLTISGSSLTASYGINAGSATIGAGPLLVGTTAAQTSAQGTGLIQLLASGSNTILDQYNYGTLKENIYAWHVARGTQFSSSAISANDIFGAMVGYGYDGATEGHTPEIMARAKNNWTTTDHSSYWNVYTASSGALGQVISFQIGADGANGVQIPNGVVSASSNTLLGSTAVNIGATLAVSHANSDTISAKNSSAYIGDQGYNTGVGIQSLTSSPYGISIQGMDSAASNVPLILNSRGGNIGVGTASPTTKISLYGVLTSSSTQGSISCSAGTPVLSATATDMHGSFTAGAAAANCTYTFGTAWPKKPECFCNDSTSVLALKATATTNDVTCTAAVSLGGDTITYICLGAP